MAHTKMLMIGKVWCSRALTLRSKTEGRKGRKGRHCLLLKNRTIPLKNRNILLMENTSAKT